MLAQGLESGAFWEGTREGRVPHHLVGQLLLIRKGPTGRHRLAQAIEGVDGSLGVLVLAKTAAAGSFLQLGSQ
jgi:hypothetical protein